MKRIDDQGSATSVLLPYKWLAVLAFLLPRVAVSYPLYALSSFLLALDSQHMRRGVLFSVLILFACTLQIAVLSFFYRVSYVNMLLDYVQILPFFLLMLAPMASWAKDSRLIIYVNYIVFILSIANMTLNYGFPMQLPYVHHLPDIISAFWALGGVKIVTVCGFMGILALICNPQDRTSLAWGIVIFNFILPSYNIGIGCGLIALSYLFLRNLSLVTLVRIGLLGGIFAITVIPYVVERLELLNSMFADEYGLHPKVYAAYMYLSLIVTDPGVFFLGGGLGNISGTAALWANESLNAISANTPLQIPGMFESELHQRTVGEALSIIETQPWAVHSSLNKPYFTFVTLLFELGFFVGLAAIFFFFRGILRGGMISEYGVAVAIFIAMMFLIDNMHSNPLFWGALLIGMRALLPHSKQNMQEVIPCRGD